MSEFHVRQGPHEFQRGLSGRSSHLHLRDARPCTRFAAETHRSIEPLQARSQLWLWQKIGAGIDARNHGMNILKSRRGVWNLRRGRPRAIALPVSAASRNDRLQAVPQLTPPKRLGQAVFDTEIPDLVLPKDESRLNDDGRRDAERAQLV